MRDRAIEETYLGDSVYVSFDGFQLWLRTGDEIEQRIALEPMVYAALVRYRNALFQESAEP